MLSYALLFSISLGSCLLFAIAGWLFKEHEYVKSSAFCWILFAVSIISAVIFLVLTILNPNKKEKEDIIPDN